MCVAGWLYVCICMYVRIINKSNVWLAGCIYVCVCMLCYVCVCVCVCVCV